MAYFSGYASINGKEVKVEQTGDQASVDTAMRAFFQDLGVTLAASVVVKRVQVKGSKRKPKKGTK